MLIPIVVSAVSAISIGLYRHLVEDRVPLIPRVLGVIMTGVFVFFAAWAALEAPTLLLVGLGAFLILNLFDGLLATSSRLDTVPAHPFVWAEPLVDLRRSGWTHLGTWHLDVGGKRPELTIYQRPDDGTRLTALGTAPQGGIVEIQSLFDGGIGYLSTLNKRSRTIRPPWMFKQAFPDATVDELVRAHDEAAHYLEVMGATRVPFPEGDPVEAMRVEHRKIRSFVSSRWWLTAIQPLVVLLTPSRSRQLHQQADIERQVERYRAVLSSERTSLSPTTP